MKQVLMNKRETLLANVLAPLIEIGHVLVDVANSLISTGTVLDSVRKKTIPMWFALSALKWFLFCAFCLSMTSETFLTSKILAVDVAGI
jgi:hypothetical protein